MQLWRILIMIRKLLNGDIDRVADIWLKTSLDEATGEKEYTML